jgi:hypothetical protein
MGIFVISKKYKDWLVLYTVIPTPYEKTERLWPFFASVCVFLKSTNIKFSK